MKQISSFLLKIKDEIKINKEPTLPNRIPALNVKMILRDFPQQQTASYCYSNQYPALMLYLSLTICHSC